MDHEIRVDAVIVIALLGGAFALYGPRWPILAALLVVRAFISLAARSRAASRHAARAPRSRAEPLGAALPAARAAELQFPSDASPASAPAVAFAGDARRHRPCDIAFTHAVLRQ
jgi:phosphatidylglycerophosphate synthase